MPDPIRPSTGVAVENAATQELSLAMSGDETAGDDASPKFAPPAQPDEIGKLGPYRVLKLLGHGGMGAVYLGLDERLGRKLALKVMLPKFAANPAAKGRFLREARAAAQITHDNVVTVYEADERDGVPFIAMQFLQGYALDEFLKKKGNPSLPQILRIARETAAGLAAAHKIGLVHRDIKPGNLWLEAPNGRVKVLDFGLARPVDSEAELTKSGAIIGTPAFMSPEQGRGLKVDGRTDLFSLGAVLYRLCTGKLPFEGANVMAVLTSLAMDEPTPVRELNPEVPVALAELIHQLLAKKTEDRPPSADEVVKRVRAMQEKPAAEVQTVSPQTTQPPVMVYVPMQVTAVPESAFADLGDDDSEIEEESRPIAKPAPVRTKRMPWLLIGSALAFLVCAAIAGVVIIKITNKDGSVTEIKVPEGSKIEVDGKTVTPGTKKPNPIPRAADDVDGKAADYALSIGGTVRVNGAETDIKATADLPRVAVKLTGVNLQSTPVTDAGLANFKDCTNLTLLSLFACENVSDAGLAHFKDCKKLQYLYLDFSQLSDAGLANFKDCKNLMSLGLTKTKVGDAGLANFKDCENLMSLNLGNTLVTDAGLAHFEVCKKLTGLFLSGSVKMGDAGMAHFKGCKNLEALDLSDTQVSNAGLANFKDCKNLTGLNLSRAKVGDAGLAHFKDCKMLNHLNLIGTQMSDAGLAHFKDCQDLWMLNLTDTTVGDAGLDHIKDCKILSSLVLLKTKVSAAKFAELKKQFPKCKIESDHGTYEPVDPDRIAANYVLAIGGTVQVNGLAIDIKAPADLPKEAFQLSWVNLTGNKQVSDAGLASFKGCKGLQHLGLHGCVKVSDVGLAAFKESKNLTYLSLSSTLVNDAGLANFADCKDLTALELQGTQLGDAGLANFKDCKKLMTLYLNGTQVTDVGLAQFKNCKSLKDLALTGEQVSDVGLIHFKDSKNLMSLNLQDTRVTDAGLGYFEDCKNLTMLILAGTKAGDAGLLHFKDCRNLAHLYIKKTNVTAAKFEELKKQFPKCKIESDHGTYEPK